MSPKFIEKKHRLPLELYRGCVRAHFTICVQGNSSLFTNHKIVDRFLEFLSESLTKFHCLNWVYTFMPDHLHILIEGKNENADLWRAVVNFKQKTGYFMSKNGIDCKWQKDFYDHILRKDEDLVKHLRYILDNPVRAGLVKDWREYPYSGSLDFNLVELLR